ncbi:replication initiator protein A [Salmonella enterica subsp. enterica serovar Virchow]|nr:replication initiator protein A [Salmonella enterica]ECS2986266.1 replication protein RepA [Salmonella enterica subsp. enterica serovar Reading]EDB3234699.1 replication initiator protein A [Salmonella enterica subsp. enterica serovar Virchow]EKC8290680.1 replication initiator protein A [Escherichia coli]ECU6114022.1 replication protein RepA [Salmonella enterica subsp. enterica serovar Reading]OLX12142.1 replication protein RepA [Salmonella enterica subsp. enterica serovar Heidelberg]
MTSPRHIGEPANELLSRLEKLQKTVQERHAKRVESAALPGETFDQAEARLKREDEERQEQEQRAKELLAKGAAGKSIVRKAPKGDEQKDFFVPTLYDVGARDTRNIMDVAVFRLSKRNRRAGEVITYELPDGVVKVSAGAAGMASIWDYDLVLMAISHLTEAMNRYREGKGDKPGRTFRPHIGDVLKFLRRADGGKQKADLVETCLRLNTTHVAVQRVRKGRNGRMVSVSEGEPLIASYKVVTNPTTNAPEFLEIDVAKWMYQEVTEGKNPDVLTVHPDYFLIDPGIGRFVYRLARQAAGRSTATWNFQTIYERSGSAGTLKKFTENLRKIITSDTLPEYNLSETTGRQGPMLVMRHRDYVEAIKEADE